MERIVITLMAFAIAVWIIMPQVFILMPLDSPPRSRSRFLLLLAGCALVDMAVIGLCMMGLTWLWRIMGWPQ